MLIFILIEFHYLVFIFNFKHKKNFSLSNKKCFAFQPQLFSIYMYEEQRAQNIRIVGADFPDIDAHTINQ